MEFTILLPIGQYILRDPTMTTVFYSRPTAITTATRKFQSCTILTPRTAIRRDLQNTFIIQSLRISEYLKLQYSHFSPKYASKVLTYTTNYPVITQLFPDYPVKPTYSRITQEKTTYSRITNSYVVNHSLFANYYFVLGITPITTCTSTKVLLCRKYNTCTL